ncbi:putative Ig domain-containing protein [Photobacterium alginatilyticum]|uniref:putative Ig domain-containing protein n=1 Tax=Photobacterium alginatilyticum TaxID=1775171 RepID=UPI004067CCE6
MHFKYSVLAASLAATLSMTGCGGDGSSSSVTPAPQPDSQPTSFTFTVIDGYIANAAISVDTDNSGTCETPLHQTDLNGQIKIPATYQNNKVCAETTDGSIDSTRGPLKAGIKLSAPAGSKVATPFTTMKVNLIESGLSASDAEKQIIDALNTLNLTSEQVFGDYIAAANNNTSADLNLKKLNLVGETLVDHQNQVELKTLKEISTVVAAIDDAEILEKTAITVSDEGLVSKNERPKITSDSAAKIALVQDMTMPEILLTATDADSDKIKWTFSGLPKGISATINEQNNTATLAGTTAQTGTFKVQIVAIDAQGARSMVTHLTFTVEGNQAPQLKPDIEMKDVVASYDQTIDPIETSGYFDDPENDLLTYSAAGLPAGLAINEGTGDITGTIKQAGKFNVEVTAKDLRNSSQALQFSIIIKNETPPVTGQIAPQTIKQGQDIQPVDLSMLFGTDPDGGEVTYEFENAPSGIILVGHTLKGNSQKAGVFPIRIYAVDDEKERSEAVSFELTVEKKEGELPAPEYSFADYEGKPLSWLVWENSEGFIQLELTLADNTIISEEKAMGSYTVQDNGSIIFDLDDENVQEVVSIAYSNNGTELLIDAIEGINEVIIQNKDKAALTTLRDNLTKVKSNGQAFAPDTPYVRVYDENSDSSNGNPDWRCETITFTSGNTVNIATCDAPEKQEKIKYVYDKTSHIYTLSEGEDSFELAIAGGKDQLLLVAEKDFPASFFFKDHKEGKDFHQAVYKEKPAMGKDQLKVLIQDINTLTNKGFVEGNLNQFLNGTPELPMFEQQGTFRWDVSPSNPINIYIVGKQGTAIDARITDAIAYHEALLGDIFTEPRYLDIDTSSYRDFTKDGSQSVDNVIEKLQQDYQSVGGIERAFVFSLDTAVVIPEVGDYSNMKANVSYGPYTGATTAMVNPTTHAFSNDWVSWINLGNMPTDGTPGAVWDKEIVIHEMGHALGLRHQTDGKEQYYGKWSPEAAWALKTIYTNEPNTPFDAIEIATQPEVNY